MCLLSMHSAPRRARFILLGHLSIKPRLAMAPYVLVVLHLSYCISRSLGDVDSMACTMGILDIAEFLHKLHARRDIVLFSLSRHNGIIR